MLRITTSIRNPLQSPVNMVAMLQKRMLAVTIHFAAETVADKSSDRDQHGIEQVENRGDRTDGHIAQPQVLADERKHHVEYLSVRLIEQVGDPQQGQHLPICILYGLCRILS